MTKTLMAFVVLLVVASTCFAQEAGYPSSSVIIGQTATGQSRIVTVIPLKFLDPAVAAQLFGGFALQGTAVGVPAQGTGEYDSIRSNATGRGRSWGSRNTSGNYGDTSGYQGYGQALQRGQQYPGYQSPYGNR